MVILASEIEYQPFTDEQLDSFATAAGIEYANTDQVWREDLNEAAKDLLIEYAGSDWPTPSAMRKQLVAVQRDPDKFLQRLNKDAELRSSPVATAILHGTRWTPEQLEKATEFRADFIAGVNREIDRLTKIIAWRKDRKTTGNAGDKVMARFVERLAWVFQEAFAQPANVGLSVPTSSRMRAYDDGPQGPFIAFSRSVTQALENNLPGVLRSSQLSVRLKSMTINSSIFNYFARSDYYRLTTSLKT